MKLLRNLPLEPAPLAALISVRPGAVVSMSLCRSAHMSLTLFAFAAGESISEEAYPGDTLYTVLEGAMPLSTGGRELLLQAGESLCVPADTLHAIGGGSAFKLLQLTVNE